MEPETRGDYQLLMGLRRKLRASRRRSGLFHVVPWINILLLLFLFYVVQQQRLVAPGVTVALPDAASDGGAPADSDVVTVLRGGVVFYHDERVASDRLEAAIRARRNGRASLLIEADGSVPNATLIAVCEAARTAGYSNVVFATRLRSDVISGAP